MSRFPSMGVVILDNPSYPATSAGYAVTEEGGRRINRLSDLASGYVWYTSVGFAEFKKAQLFKHANLRGDQLLRTSMSSIIHEIGLEHASMPEQANAVFAVLQEVGLYLHQNLGWNDRVFGRLDWYMANYLGTVGRRAPAAVTMAARNAHEYMTPAMISSNPDATSRTYIAPRLPYLRSLLDLPIPALDADWEFRELSGLADSTRLMQEGGLGALFEVSVSDLESDLAIVAPFAARQALNADHRLWCPLPEAMFYADRANLTVRGAWVPSKVAPLSSMFALAEAKKLKPIPSEEFDFSYSAGLVGESVLYSLLGTTASDKPPTGREPVAAFVAAYDRLMMIRMALRIYDMGYTPMSSACGGRVVVSLPAMAIEDLDLICAEAGLEPPMTGS